MGSATQYETFSDLYTGLLNAVREDTSITATVTQAKRYINIGLQDMHLGTEYKFPWAESHAVLVTQPKYQTGTLSISQGSTTITGTGTAWNTANNFSVTNMRAGGKIKISGSPALYEISAVGSDTSATLTSAFTGEDVSGAAYTYFEDEYDLASDFSKPVDQQNFDLDQSIPLMDRQTFRFRYVRNYTPGRPVVATILQKPFNGDTDTVRKVRFHNPPDKAYTIPYSYITKNLVVQADGTRAEDLVEDTDEPIVYKRYRHAIVFWALYHWYRDRRDDARTNLAKSEYTDVMVRTLSDIELGSRRLRIRPKTASYRAKAMTPYRGMRNRRYSLNDEFDRFE